jgi:hypothetical protein
MATKTLVCPECATPLSRGRFACTACGAVVASVASTPRTLGWAEELAAPLVTTAPPIDAHEPNGHDEAAHQLEAVAPIGPAWLHGPLERAPGEDAPDMSDDELPAAEADVAVEAVPAEDEPVVEPTVTAAPELPVDPAPAAAAETYVAGADAADAADEPEADVAEASASVDFADVATEARPEPTWPETRAWPPIGSGPAMPVAETSPPPRAGAYLPPSAVLATVSEPARLAPSMTSVAVATTEPKEAAVDGETRAAPWRSLPDIAAGLPPRVVAAGAAVATLGFLLPWAQVVIGSGRIGGWLEQWGLAGPGHPLLAMLVIALAAGALLSDRMPAWVRPGLPAVMLASLLIGILWPYLFGSQPKLLGVYATLTGALLLGIGGLLDLWDGRHAGPVRTV